MKNFILGLFGITPNLAEKFEHLKERSDHLRKHIIVMEEKLEHIDKAITFLLAEAKK